MINNAIMWFKIGMAAAVSIAIKALGGWDVMLEVLITLTCLDFMTGILVAASRRELNSMKGFTGIIKKIGMYVMIAVVVAAGRALGHNELRGVVLGFFIGTEMISIVENWAAFGLPIPKKLKSILKELTDKQ